MSMKMSTKCQYRELHLYLYNAGGRDRSHLLSTYHALLLRLLLNLYYHVIRNARPQMVYLLIYH